MARSQLASPTRGCPRLELGARKSQARRGDIPGWRWGRENPRLDAGISRAGGEGEKIPGSTLGYPGLEVGARKSQPLRWDIPGWRWGFWRTLGSSGRFGRIEWCRQALASTDEIAPTKRSQRVTIAPNP